MAFLHAYIRMGSTRVHRHYASTACAWEKYTPRDMVLHVYQNGIYTVPLATTSSLCHKGEIYTQGHGIPPCISKWDLQVQRTST
jgi:hypothetical protein